MDYPWPYILVYVMHHSPTLFTTGLFSRNGSFFLVPTVDRYHQVAVSVTGVETPVVTEVIRSTLRGTGLVAGDVLDWVMASYFCTTVCHSLPEVAVWGGSQFYCGNIECSYSI